MEIRHCFVIARYNLKQICVIADAAAAVLLARQLQYPHPRTHTNKFKDNDAEIYWISSVFTPILEVETTHLEET